MCHGQDTHIFLLQHFLSATIKKKVDTSGPLIHSASSHSADSSIVRIYEFLCSSDSAWGPLNCADTKHHIAIYETVM